MRVCGKARWEGTARFRITEVFPERFFKCCAEKGVRLTDVRKEADEIRCSVAFRERERLLALVRDEGGKAEILFTSGIPKYLYLYRKRIGVPCGVLLFFLIVGILASVVWGVEVTGLDPLEKEPFLRFMEDSGVRPGIFSAAVDCAEAEFIAESYDESFSAVTVNLIGSKIYIHVEKRRMPPKIDEEDAYRDLIAGKDGVVLDADAYAGKLLVGEGEEVRRGDVLISGIASFSDGGVRFLRARGSVTAQTENRFRVSVPDKIRIKRIRSRRRTALPYVFMRIPLRDETARDAAGDSCRYRSEKLLRIGDAVLPVGISLLSRFSFGSDLFIPTPTEAFLIAYTGLCFSASEKLREAELLSKTESVTESGQAYLEGTYLCREEIAVDGGGVKEESGDK